MRVIVKARLLGFVLFLFAGLSLLLAGGIADSQILLILGGAFVVAGIILFVFLTVVICKLTQLIEAYCSKCNHRSLKFSHKTTEKIGKVKLSTVTSPANYWTYDKILENKILQMLELRERGNINKGIQE